VWWELDLVRVQQGDECVEGEEGGDGDDGEEGWKTWLVLRQWKKKAFAGEKGKQRTVNLERVKRGREGGRIFCTMYIFHAAFYSRFCGFLDNPFLALAMGLGSLACFLC
jgi:hypothetical protein